VSPRKATIEVEIPSPEERVAKIEKIAESAQRVADAIKGAPPKTVQGERVTLRVDGVPVGVATGLSFNTASSKPDAKPVVDHADIESRESDPAFRAEWRPFMSMTPEQFAVAQAANMPGHVEFLEWYNAQAAAILAKRAKCWPTKPAPKPDGVGTIEPMELRHARMNVEDLRKKLDGARRELRYQRAIAPAGTKRVDGFVSAVKGRETSRHVAMHVYLDGERARRVLEAHSGAEGFIITCDDGNPDARHMKTGIVHVFEFTGVPSALPDSLEFAP
jgi:hypothetical protein